MAHIIPRLSLDLLLCESFYFPIYSDSPLESYPPFKSFNPPQPPILLQVPLSSINLNHIIQLPLLHSTSLSLLLSLPLPLPLSPLHYPPSSFPNNQYPSWSVLDSLLPASEEAAGPHTVMTTRPVQIFIAKLVPLLLASDEI